MSNILRMVLLVGLILYFGVVYYFLKKKKLALKYTLLWLATGLVLLVLVLIPELLTVIVHILGIELPVNGLFTIGIALILIILLSLTVIVSGMSFKIRVLVQQVALLEEQMRSLRADLERKE